MTKAKQESSERDIPLPIQREVRQRCGFGCVICGIPIYEYHHIKFWSKVREHVANDLTLLCPNHHTQLHKNFLSNQNVIRANNNPYNLKFGQSNPHFLYFEGDSCEVNIGNNSFTFSKEDRFNEFIALMVENIPLIKFVMDDNRLFLNLVAYNRMGEIILQVVNNYLFYSTRSWDIEFINQTLSIRQGSRKFIIQIKFEPPSKISIEKGNFFVNKKQVVIEKNKVSFLKSSGETICSFSECSTYNTQVGICI